MSKVAVAKLKRLRKERNLSLEQVAKRLGVATATYWRMEQSGENCKADHLFILADLYGIALGELLCDDEVKLPAVFLMARSRESLAALRDIILKYQENFIDADAHLKRIDAAINSEGTSLYL